MERKNTLIDPGGQSKSDEWHHCALSAHLCFFLVAAQSLRPPTPFQHTDTPFGSAHTMALQPKQSFAAYKDNNTIEPGDLVVLYLVTSPLIRTQIRIQIQRSSQSRS
jgi:hypothetical protein